MIFLILILSTGPYECRVSNGIGETQSAVAHLNVECKKEKDRIASHPISIIAFQKLSCWRKWKQKPFHEFSDFSSILSNVSLGNS